MTTRKISALLISILLGAAAFAQTGHPAKGSWLGYWGPDNSNQRRIRLLMDWEDREITGVINPGRNSVTIDSTSIDYDTWTLTIEAEMPAADGELQTFIAVGVLDNLGSWTNRRYAGTYNFGDESGSFELLLN
jgi:hypothetical protein